MVNTYDIEPNFFHIKNTGQLSVFTERSSSPQFQCPPFKLKSKEVFGIMLNCSQFWLG